MVTIGYRESQGVTGSYKGLREAIRGFKGAYRRV